MVINYLLLQITHLTILIGKTDVCVCVQTQTCTT